MKLTSRQQALDALLLAFRDLWHPQPFRERRPAWCQIFPALTADLLNLPDATVDCLNNDENAALRWLTHYFPPLAELGLLINVAQRPVLQRAVLPARLAWEIPGRKQAQIEAFAATAQSPNLPVLDWCGGKGHLGRLLASQWQVEVSTLEIDPLLCQAGDHLAVSAAVPQKFICGDALTVDPDIFVGKQAVALHACGDLHRTLLRQAAAAAIDQLDLVPCCYHRGVDAHYLALSAPLGISLSRDDTRLAVTETVTASPRLARQRDREMAWKLAFSELSQEILQESQYRSFKSIPAAWYRNDFSAFIGLVAARQGMVLPNELALNQFEAKGWQRQREVMRLSIVRHAFRRALEIWLALDLAVYLEQQSYRVELGIFCQRQLTPRNLLISAYRA